MKSEGKPARNSATQSAVKPRANHASKMHPENPFANGYPMAQLVTVKPELAQFLLTTPRGEQSISFADPLAVKCLNQALLAWQYQLTAWDIPDGFLCPAVPGRLDYILHLKDLLIESNGGKLPKMKYLQWLDIGCGANLIYPLLAVKAVGGHVIAAELDVQALAHAEQLVANHQLQSRIELRQQQQSTAIFHGIIQPRDVIDITLCNPPFHHSAAEAAAGSQRKRQNLGLAPDAALLNFAGRDHELWCEGGELAFLTQMARESVDFANQVFWFSSLVAKVAHVEPLCRELRQLGAQAVKVIEMGQGQKLSRFIAWSFLAAPQRQLWQQHRWM